MNGNLTQKTQGTDVWIYDWDAENRLKRVRRNGADVATYVYDALGRRAERFVATGIRLHEYVYDGEDIVHHTFTSPLMEGDLIDPSLHIYVHGPGIDEPLAVEHGTGANWYYHADGLGSIVRVTNDSGALDPDGSRQYDAFGNLQSPGTFAEGYAYTGREWDPETGLYYYRARYYDPKIGRFLSEDPIGFASGPNFYPYVGNNPATWTDPSGLVIVNRGPTTMHLEPSAFVGSHCSGHVGCTDTRAAIRHRCYQQGDCWRVEFTVSMSIDMWVANDFYFPWKQAVVEAHERGHAAISEKWFDQVVADARTMESYKFCSESECERKAQLFERAWFLKLRLRQFFYEVWN